MLVQVWRNDEVPRESIGRDAAPDWIGCGTRNRRRCPRQSVLVWDCDPIPIPSLERLNKNKTKKHWFAANRKNFSNILIGILRQKILFLYTYSCLQANITRDVCVLVCVISIEIDESMQSLGETVCDIPGRMRHDLAATATTGRRRCSCLYFNWSVM